METKHDKGALISMQSDAFERLLTSDLVVLGHPVKRTPRGRNENTERNMKGQHIRASVPDRRGSLTGRELRAPTRHGTSHGRRHNASDKKARAAWFDRERVSTPPISDAQPGEHFGQNYAIVSVGQAAEGERRRTRLHYNHLLASNQEGEGWSGDDEACAVPVIQYPRRGERERHR